MTQVNFFSDQTQSCTTLVDCCSDTFGLLFFSSNQGGRSAELAHTNNSGHVLGGQLETREIEHFIMNIFQLMKINDRDQRPHPFITLCMIFANFCPHLITYLGT